MVTTDRQRLFLLHRPILHRVVPVPGAVVVMVMVLLLLFLLLLFLLLFLLLLLVFGRFLLGGWREVQLKRLNIKLIGAHLCARTVRLLISPVANSCIIGGDSQSPPPLRLWARRDPILVLWLRLPQALGRLLLLLLLPVLHTRYNGEKKHADISGETTQQ